MTASSCPRGISRSETSRFLVFPASPCHQGCGGIQLAARPFRPGSGRSRVLIRWPSADRLAIIEWHALVRLLLIDSAPRVDWRLTPDTVATCRSCSALPEGRAS